MNSFLVSLAMAILERFLTKGTIAFGHYLALQQELAKAKKDAENYEKIVNTQTADRVDRRKAEDEALN